MKKAKSLLLSLTMVGLLAGSVFANVYTFDIPAGNKLDSTTPVYSADTLFGKLSNPNEFVTGMDLKVIGQSTAAGNGKLHLSFFTDNVLGGLDLFIAGTDQGSMNPLTYTAKITKGDDVDSDNFLALLNSLMHNGSSNVFFTMTRTANSGSPVFDTKDGGFFKVTTAVPEPGTLSLLGMGLLGMIGFVKRKFVA